MAVTVVQTGSGDKVSSCAVGANISAGHTVLVVIAYAAPGVPTSVTDSQAQSYTKDADSGVAVGYGVSIWRKSGTVALINTDTITCSGGDTGNLVMIVLDMAGHDGNSPTATGITNNPGGATSVTGSAGTAAGDMVVAALGGGPGHPGITAHAGWSSFFVDSNFENTLAEWLLASSGGAQTADATWGTGSGDAAALATYAPTSAGTTVGLPRSARLRFF